MKAPRLIRRFDQAWQRKQKLIVATALVPVLLILAVIGAGWSTEFDSRPDGPVEAGSIPIESPPDIGFGFFLFVAAIVMLGLFVLIIREKVWLAMLAVAALVVVFVLLGLLGGALQPEDDAPALESESLSGATIETTEATSPRLIVIWVLTGVAVAGALSAWARRQDDEPEELQVGESVSDIARNLDAASGSPRQNIIEMYASLEATLAAANHARSSFETTAEFSSRVLVQLGATADACAELAEMYQLIGFGEREARAADQALAAALLDQIGTDLSSGVIQADA